MISHGFKVFVPKPLLSRLTVMWNEGNKNAMRESGEKPKEGLWTKKQNLEKS